MTMVMRGGQKDARGEAASRVLLMTQLRIFLNATNWGTWIRTRDPGTKTRSLTTWPCPIKSRDLDQVEILVA